MDECITGLLKEEFIEWMIKMEDIKIRKVKYLMINIKNDAEIGKYVVY